MKKLLDRKRAASTPNGAPGSGAVTPSLTTPSPQTPSASAAGFASSPFFTPMPPTPTAGSSSTANGDYDNSIPRFPSSLFRLDQQQPLNGHNGTPNSRPTMNGYGSTGASNGYSVNGTSVWDPRRASNGSSVSGGGRNGSWSSTAFSRPGTSQGGFSAQEQMEMVGEMVAGVGNGSPGGSPAFYGRDLSRENGGRW